MNVITITPPVVQFNTPYPSGAYLTSFFKSEGLNAIWYDLNIHFFYSVFSADGLRRLFSLSETSALKLADKVEREGDEDTAFNLRRYVSQKENWIEWIDFITATLCGNGAREKAHQFLYSPFSPRGSRMENYIAGLEREPTVDDVRFLCTFALADLSDYITVAFDPQFSLVRYAESLAVDTRSFSDFEKQIDSLVMAHFYKPVLERVAETVIVGLEPATFAKQTCSTICTSQSSEASRFRGNDRMLICISIPFAGTFLPALYTARFFKQKFGDSVFICVGGGFVNTELREAKDPALSKYIDAISYDRGYGSYKALLSIINTVVEGSQRGGIETTANLHFADISLHSKDLGVNLNGCSKVALLAATIGPQVDALIRRHSSQDPVYASILQATGAMFIEEVVDLVNAEIKKIAEAQGLKTKPRYSPGYGDVPLDIQKEFFRLLPCTRIGLTLMDTLIMAPEKSVTAFVGLL